MALSVTSVSTKILSPTQIRHECSSLSCINCSKSAPTISLLSRKLPSTIGKTRSRMTNVRNISSREFLGESLAKMPLLPKRGKPSGLIVRAGPGLPIASMLDVNEVDRQKAEGMPYRRTVFTFDDWTKHRSSGRYVRHLQTMFSSRVINALIPPVFSVTAISALICLINTLVASHDLPEWVPLLHLNALPFSLTSSALSFLLVFRTNASYGRFDEARKMWGLMLNRTRDIGRQALSYMARDEYSYERPKLLQFIRHLQAFPLAYKHHFLQEGTLENDLRTLTKLTEPEIEAILASTHRPNYVLQMCSEIMRSTHINPVARLSMDQNLTTFADDIGGCERLFKTPIPLSYTRLTSRFLILWHIFLPLGLWDACGILTVPVTASIAATLFCVDEVGVLIEEPFSILALAVIAQSSRNNVQELLDLHDGMKNLVVDNDPVPESVKAKAPLPAQSSAEGWEDATGSWLSTPATVVDQPVAPVLPVASAAAPVPVEAVPQAVASVGTVILPTPFDNGSTIRTERPGWSK